MKFQNSFFLHFLNTSKEFHYKRLQYQPLHFDVVYILDYINIMNCLISMPIEITILMEVSKHAKDTIMRCIKK